MAKRFKLRRGTAAAWAAANPVLLDQEPGREVDTRKIKYGDGVTPWNDLDYWGGAGCSSGAIDSIKVGDVIIDSQGQGFTAIKVGGVIIS
jgi:hypothetical protein